MSKQRINRKPKRLTSNRRKKMMSRLASRDGNKCQECGSTKRLTIDHIIPIKDGGTSRFENLQLLCFGCNMGKDKEPRDSNSPQEG
jgi:5-methylcytosine-specific restriction endonuclease McrA